MSKNTVYWIFQFFGWFAFVFINAIFIRISNKANIAEYFSLGLLFVLGVLFSHLYRYIIIRYKWLSVKTAALIPRFLLAAILLGFITYAIGNVFNALATHQKIQFLKSDIAGALNLSFVYLVWSLIYFLVNFIENYRKEEIKNLRYEATMNEIKLNQLKSQLNPHFMFNAMNSIRALIDENPEKAKQALTQFSNILRNALQMGKTKTVPFLQEIELVKDYLDVENIRYEERLQVNYQLDEKSYEFQIPPMILQTLIENAIKHGISKLAKGGYITITSKVENDLLIITIKNTGVLYNKAVIDSKGYGINNTKQRLNILYGNKAQFTIEQTSEKEVTCRVVIPKYIN